MFFYFFQNLKTVTFYAFQSLHVFTNAGLHSLTELSILKTDSIQRNIETANLKYNGLSSHKSQSEQPLIRSIYNTGSQQFD